MAKIDFPDSTFFKPAVYTGIKAETAKKQDKPSVRKGQRPFFSGIMEQLSRNTEAAVIEDLPVSEETVNELLDEVHSAGDALKNRPLAEEIQCYKKAVRNFMHYVVEHGYTSTKQISGANLLKRKNFTIVQVVDRKLEQLAAGILAGQTAQMAILARLEEITGLLVDLMQ
jgi:uncharacterized protein YaaR (DUF327 family)